MGTLWGYSSYSPPLYLVEDQGYSLHPPDYPGPQVLPTFQTVLGFLLLEIVLQGSPMVP